ncbi:MAG TPA: LPS export ABC transporter periplasmic protein LptC [Thermoanaerobaculia bacterium]|nr:LPS export ABC transporter periplasmic protein LptC [Thermoanaerobaculia bacterium]
MVRKARSPIALIRKLLLAAFILTVLGVAALFMFGRAGQRGENPLDERATKGGKGMTLIGEDFDYTFTEGERPIFRIRGDSIKADREETLYLEGVAVTLYDKQGREFHLESKRAAFNRGSNQGQLQGDVLLKGPGNLELRTNRLDLLKKGNVVASRGPVEIRYAARYIVHAARMQVDVQEELYVLQGGTRVNSVPGVEPPVAITSQRLVYERKKRWLRIEGGANLRRGLDRLSARRIFGNLSEDESALTFVHAFWDINGETRSTVQPAGGAPQPTTVRFRGKDLAVLLQPTGNQVRRVELDGAKEGGGKAVMEAVGPGIVRTLTARRIEGVLTNGVLSAAEGLGGIEIRETSKVEGRTVVRTATGQRGTADFRPDGQLTRVELHQAVTYRDGQVTATGNLATVDMEEGRGEFFGAPVVVASDRGRMDAPRVVYNTDNQIVTARGGVRALLTRVEETAMAGTPLSEGEGPVHVESQEAFWRQEPSSFLFRGDVRAWRGENLLLAPELRGDRAADQLVATGGVKTLWFPTPEQRAKSAARKEGEGTGQKGPIQVVSNEMNFLNKQGVLVYTGNVRVDQEGRTLTCQRLEVKLGEKEREAEKMTCTGDTKLNDPKAGRRVEGQRAVYEVGQRQVDIFGEPVVMRDKDGNVVRGRRVVYFMEDGRVEVKGKDEVAPAAVPNTAPAAPGGAAGSGGR